MRGKKGTDRGAGREAEATGEGSDAREGGGVLGWGLRGCGGYVVVSETRAGWISFRGLFVEETLRLRDSGIVSESPSAHSN